MDNESWAATPSFGSNLRRYSAEERFYKPFAQSADWHSLKGLTFWKTEALKLQHHSQTNDLGARLEVAEWAAFRHPATILAHPAHFKPAWFDRSKNVVEPKPHSKHAVCAKFEAVL